MSHDNRSESIPMPSPKPPRMLTGSHAALDPDDDSPRAVALRARRAERIAEYTREQLGAPPNPVTGAEGSGLWGAVGAVLLRVEHVDAVAATILTRLDAADARATTRGGWAATRAEKVIDALLVAAFLAVAVAALRRFGW